MNVDRLPLKNALSGRVQLSKPNPIPNPLTTTMKNAGSDEAKILEE